MFQRYRKKPVVINAVKWTGKGKEIVEWCNGDLYVDGTLSVPTIEGSLTVQIGDYIIRGVAGEFYPCKPDIFEKTYDLVEDD